MLLRNLIQQVARPSVPLMHACNNKASTTLALSIGLIYSISYLCGHGKFVYNNEK